MAGIGVVFWQGHDVAKIGQWNDNSSCYENYAKNGCTVYGRPRQLPAEVAKTWTNKQHLNGRSVNIGMDAALTVGHPTKSANYFNWYLYHYY